MTWKRWLVVYLVGFIVAATVVAGGDGVSEAVVWLSGYFFGIVVMASLGGHDLP